MSIGKPLQFMVRIDAWDPVAAAAKPVYLGTRGFTTQPGDTPANTYFEPYLRSALRRRSSLYRRRRIGGDGVPTRGVVIIELCDVTRPWRSLYFGGRPVTVWQAEAGAAWAAHQIVFQGICSERFGSADSIDIPIADGKKRFETPLQPAKFAGTGGAEGGADLKGKFKPIGLGYCENVTAILLDRATSLYGLGTAINSIVKVMDRGIALTQVGGTPAGGQYSVNLAAGTFTLGYSPVDPSRDITATFEGWKPASGYHQTAGTLIKAIAKDVIGLVDGDLDLASFTELEALNSARVGLWLPAGAECLGIIDRLLDTIGGWWTFTRDGKMRVGRLDAPAGAPVASFRQGDIVLNGLRPLRMDEAAWKWTLKYRPNWTVQTNQDLAGGSTYYSRDLLAEQHRATVAFDNDIKADFPDAAEEEIETLFTDEAAAVAEAARRLALYGQRRDVWEADILAVGFERNLGDEVGISHPESGDISGIVIGLDDIARLQQSTLEIWL